MKLSKDGLIPDLIRWSSQYMSEIRTRGYSKNSIKTYQAGIEKFIEHMREFQDELGMESITRPYIISYLDSLDSKREESGMPPLSSSTKKIYIQSLKNFFGYISDNNDQYHDYGHLFKKIKLPRGDLKSDRIRYFTKSEAEQLVSYADRRIREARKAGRWVELRDLVMLKTIYYSGLRVSEAAGILKKDIASDGEYLQARIVGKGGKRSYVYIPPPASADLKSYLESEWIPKEAKNNPYLFPSAKGGRLSRIQIYRAMKQIYRKAGLPLSKKGVHILRHSLAMRMVERGVDSMRIQKVLRHSSLETTLIYARIGDHEAKGALDATFG